MGPPVMILLLAPLLLDPSLIEPIARRLITQCLAAELSANAFQLDQLKRTHSFTSSPERFLSFNFIAAR